MLLTGEGAHDFPLQFFGHRVTELAGYLCCYILSYETTARERERDRETNSDTRIAKSE